jgi:hypothetical protein
VRNIFRASLFSDTSIIHVISNIKRAPSQVAQLSFMSVPAQDFLIMVSISRQRQIVALRTWNLTRPIANQKFFFRIFNPWKSNGVIFLASMRQEHLVCAARDNWGHLMQYTVNYVWSFSIAKFKLLFYSNFIVFLFLISTLCIFHTVLPVYVISWEIIRPQTALAESLKPIATINIGDEAWG